MTEKERLNFPLSPHVTGVRRRTFPSAFGFVTQGVSVSLMDLVRMGTRQGHEKCDMFRCLAYNR